ncbi:MAG: hypothetical protein M3Z16_11800 [Pseudomonadota bacterium]|nr:hypothetical protein [Pseudomonadota bacterium]
MPEVLGGVAAEERVLEHLTLTTEPGVIGGMPKGGLDFGAAANTQALLHQNQQFDFYDGGGLAGGLRVGVEDGRLRYVTERCVFSLQAGGLQLTEVAPGIDVERDILAHMEFQPLIGEVKCMNARLYGAGPTGFAAALLDLQLAERLSYDGAATSCS